MSLDLGSYRDVAISHAMATGLFGNVLDHEPVSAPGSGLTYAVWVSDIAPVPAASGLDSLSARLELTGRVFLSADTEPQGAVDTSVTDAVSALFAAYAGDFEFGGNVRNVDLLGMHGAGLRARLGFTRFDSTTYRVATLTVPLIINDLWEEVA
ncbi:hypothetical protein ABZT03_11670 [Streptomyces sp. NPDC005574]|uniref:hypothetical protein n=1 Tax=Streptomyces sp. NPDC005574 TaxID=3156891 RepID=UPI0033BDE4C0